MRLVTKTERTALKMLFLKHSLEHRQVAEVLGLRADMFSGMLSGKRSVSDTFTADVKAAVARLTGQGAQ